MQGCTTDENGYQGCYHSASPQEAQQWAPKEEKRITSYKWANATIMETANKGKARRGESLEEEKECALNMDIIRRIYTP